MERNGYLWGKVVDIYIEKCPFVPSFGEKRNKKGRMWGIDMRIQQSTQGMEQERRMLGGTKTGENAVSNSRKSKKHESENLKGGRLFVGNLQQNLQKSTVEQRREVAQSRALELMRGAFQTDMAAEDTVKEINKGAEIAKKEMLSYQEEFRKTGERRKEIEADEMLSPKEREEALKEIEDAEKYFARQRDNQKDILNASDEAIKEIRKAGRASAPMVDAAKKAEKFLENEGKEIVAMMFDDAKSQMEAEFEQKVTKAEEAKAEKKEQEEKLEKMKADKKEKEESSAEIGDEFLQASTMYMLRTQKINDQVQAEIRTVAKQMKINLEDLKGAAVDEEI